MTEQLQQQIEAYLQGKLSPQETIAFEAKIKEDKALASEVKLYRQMDDLLGESDVMDFSATLQQVRTSNPAIPNKEALIKKLPARTTNTRRWLSLAAGFALIAILSTLIYNNLAPISPDTLYSANMEFPTALGGGSTLRSIDGQDLNTSKSGEITASWQTANAAYQEERYDVALQALTTIETIDPNFELENRGDYFFKKGLVQLKLEQLAAAISSFEAVQEGEYISNAEWKRALALLKVDKDKAKLALETIVNINHPERSTALKILKEL